MNHPQNGSINVLHPSVELTARSGHNNAMVRQDGFLKAHGPHRENTYSNVGGLSREFIKLKLMSYL